VRLTQEAAAPAAGRRARRFDWVGIGIPALIAYVPLLFTHPGMVGADTKTYLYLNPGKLLSEAPYLWNTQIGLGTVTHQNIGYLWPMGPFYFLFDLLNVPDWVAQRLWISTVIFLAGMGVRFLLRTLDWGALPARKAGVLVATLAYMLSPYLLNYSARISVILLPWTALPWLIGLTVRAVRRGGWLDPALFALVVLTVGGVNATALLLIGLGPLLWLVHVVVIDREASARRAIGVALRIGVLTIGASVWWIAGLWSQGKYGLPVTRYTETYRVIADASSATEVMRGLGYWLFYGNDKLGPWIEPSVTYTRNAFFLALSYGVPLLAMLSAALLRWRYRAFFLTLVLFGTLAAVAGHPWNGSSFLGGVFTDFTRTDAGLALRSTPRAVPLIALGLSVCLGAGVAALGRLRPRLTWPTAGIVAMLVIVNLPTLWNGQMVAANLERPEDVPSYWNDVARQLTETDDGTRALEIPGADFASYRWGNTIDPITPGLTTRQYAARELFLYGTSPSADLQLAVDQRYQEDTMEPEAIAPLARLVGGGDIVVRNDLMYERYRLARPRHLWQIVTAAPGLDEPIGFGPTDRNVAGPEFPLRDEIELATPPGWEDPPAVAVFGVQDRLLPIRTFGAARPVILSGSADGIVDVASLGGLHSAQGLFYSGSLADQPSVLDQMIASGADLIVTDTNRKQARSWNTTRENVGFTEQAGETLLTYKPGDQRLDLFPNAGDDTQTVSAQVGGARVLATDYGNIGTLTPNDRPVGALDGDPLTAWRVADGGDARGQRLVVVADDPVTTDHIDLLQPQNGIRSRWITRVAMRFDGGEPVVVDLTDESRSAPGQRIEIDSRPFRTLDVEILADTAGDLGTFFGQSGVGFAEIGLAGLRVREVVRPPVDLLRAAGASSQANRLSYIFTRQRSNMAEPVRTDTEIDMTRVVDVPTARSFGLSGQARLNPLARADVLDSLLRVPGAQQGGLTVRTSEALPGALRARGHAAVDGDPGTAWTTPFGGAVGHWIEVTAAAPTSVDRLDLQIVTDGNHSVPTQITVQADGDPSRTRTISIPPVVDGTSPNVPTSVPVTFAPLEGSTFRVSIDEVRPVTTRDWYSERPIEMPAAITELGFSELVADNPATTFDSGCRQDLLAIDGAPVPVRITGTLDEALDRQPLGVVACDDAPLAVTLAASRHELTTAAGRDLGIDIDRILLTSERDGTAMTLSEFKTPVVAPEPPVEVVTRGGVGFDVTVADGTGPRWLSFGQSWSPGWEATVNGRDLGPAVVVDGYANGWRLDPAELGPGPYVVRVDWTPQRTVWGALAVSVGAVLVCLGVIFFAAFRAFRRRRRHGFQPADAAAGRLWAAADETRTRNGHRALPLDPDLSPWPCPLPHHPGVLERASVRATVVAIAVLLAVMLPNLPLSARTLLVAPVVAGVAWVVFRSPRGRGVAGLAAVVAYGLAGAYAVVLGVRRAGSQDFIEIVAPVNALALAAAFLLFVEATRDVIVRRRVPDDGFADPAPPDPEEVP